MKTIQRISLQILLFLVVWSFGSATGERSGRLAVIEVTSTAPVSRAYVDNMPDMIVTELMQRTGEQLVERSRIQTALKELGLDRQGVTADGGVKVGQWVGADRVLIGSLAQVDVSLRLDLRIIEVESGRILAASEATVTGHIADLIPKAVTNLSKHLTPKVSAQYVDPDIQEIHSSKPAVQWDPQENIRPAKIRIKHRIHLSLLTEKPVPFQKVRIYMDNRLVSESPMIDAVNEEFTLFAGNLAPGKHTMKLEHYVVNRKGDHKRLLEVQPKPVELLLRPGQNYEVDYRMKVRTMDFNFEEFQVN